MQAAIKFSALALSEPHPGAAVLVGELDQWCLVSCGSVDRIGFVLLNLGLYLPRPKIIWSSLYGSTRDAASSRSELESVHLSAPAV
jgi:hypothetical protein